MKASNIRKAYENGYITKKIVCRIASVIADRYDIPEEEYNSLLSDVYWGRIDPNELSFDTSYYNNLPIPKAMEDIWENDYYLEPRKHPASTSAVIKTMVFEYPSEDGSWCSREKPSRVAISISSDGELSMAKLSGVDPTIEQAAAMVTAAAAASFEVYCYDRRKRKFPFDITVYEGQSGCRDISISIYEKIGSHYKRRRYGGDSLHISMSDKVHDFGMYLGDALEILNWCTVDDYRWSYYKMYKDAKLRLTNLGIKFSRPNRDSKK